MKVSALFFVFGMVVCQNENKLPSFTWLNEESPFGVALLKIRFPDGGSDEIVLLRKFNPIPVGANERAESVDECIYKGFLSQEKSHVTITGCAKSDTFQIQFTSNRLSNDMFKVYNGIVEGLSSETRDLMTEFIENSNRYRSNKNKELRNLNPNGYITNVKAIYDNNFLDKFGEDTRNAIRRIVAHAQHVFKWPSLTTKIFLNVSSDFQHINERLSANNKLYPVSKTYSKDWSINSHMYFTTRDPNANYSTLGKGYTAGACSAKDLALHAMLMEYQNDDITFARSLAHELGHNLGMNHDFEDDDPTKPRVDSKGNACTGIGSIMDYAKGEEGNKSQWSTCSVEDMAKMVDENPTCLKVIDPDNPPVELPDLPLTRNECDLNKVRPGLNGYSKLQLNGIRCTVLCIDGICVPSSSRCTNYSKTACQNICGADSC